MTHAQPVQPPVIDTLTKQRLRRIKHTERSGMKVIENFAIFVDTHRDQPHVGVFHDDIHRGQCRPTSVDYVIDDDILLDRETGKTLRRHDKHMFVTNEYYAQFLVDCLMSNGADPRDGSGCMPTSHFRDARAKVYEMKSFREIVRLRAKQEGIG